MRSILCLIAILLIAASALAQTRGRTTDTTYYLGFMLNQVPSLEKAVYREEMLVRADTMYQMRYLLSNGQRLTQAVFVRADSTQPRLLDGTVMYWDEQGRLTRTAQYQRGRANGWSTDFYPGGKEQRAERYTAGRRVEQRCFDLQGKLISCLLAFEYPRWLQKGYLARYLYDRIDYPKDRRTAERIGTMHLRFAIDTLGNVMDAATIVGLTPDLDRRVLEVIRGLPPFRPAKRNGRNCYSAVDLSLTFQRKHKWRRFIEGHRAFEIKVYL